jgi:hypothetical protein
LIISNYNSIKNIFFEKVCIYNFNYYICVHIKLVFRVMKNLVHIEPQPQQHPQDDEWGNYA